MARLLPMAMALAMLGALAGCDQTAPTATAEPDAAEAAVEPLTAETREGPVLATVSLVPPAPRLGDPLTLILTVEAELGVDVEMPVFGDALGRFQIVDYTPRQEATADGGRKQTQRYTLQSPMSGRQRIPQLRVEFVDERHGAAEVRELLTDELSFSVASVLPEGEVVDTLRPPRAVLQALPGPWLTRYWPWFAAAVVVLAAGGGAIWAWLRRAEARARETAYDRALARLDRLRRAGLPEAAAMDGWYVELSDIVRRYIEARFTLRAPELTTEEFLLEAGRSAALSPSHRQLLSDFLSRCDRVKFARYSPGAEESRDALAVAERFLQETRDDVVLDADAPGPDAAPRPQPATSA